MKKTFVEALVVWTCRTLLSLLVWVAGWIGKDKDARHWRMKKLLKLQKWTHGYEHTGIYYDNNEYIWNHPPHEWGCDYAD